MKTASLKAAGLPIRGIPGILCAITLLCWVAPRTGFAASGSWQSTASDGNWSTAGDWSAQPGTTAGTPGAIYGNGQDTATFNNTSAFTTITIDSNRQVASIVFATNAVSYTIGSAGANGGNALQLFDGNTITMASGLVGTNLTETFNAPLLLDPFSNGANTGNFTFANNSGIATDALVIAGSLSAGSTTTGTIPLILSGAAGSGTNVISGSVSNGLAAGFQITISGTSIWELSNPNSTFTGGVYAGVGNGGNYTSFATLPTLAIGASSVGPAGAPTSGPLGSGTIFLNGGIIEAVNGPQTIGNNMISNYDSGGGPEYCVTFGGSNNLTLTGTLFNANHYFTITVNNTALTTFAGEFDNTNQFFGFDGSGNVKLTGLIIPNSHPLIYAGIGSLAISGSQTYTQGTSVYSGTVILDGTTIANSSLASGVINVSTGAAYASTVYGPATYYTSGNATLLVKGNFLVGNAGAASINILGGNGTSTGQGTLSMVDGSINTLTINSTTAGATVLTLGANSILDMEVGSSSDSIVLGSGLKVGVTSTVLVNITGLGGMNGATQTLIQTGTNTTTFTTGAGNNFLLNSTTGNFGGYVVGLSGATAGALQLTETLTYTTPATAFWSGSISGTWNSVVNGNANNTNWLSAASSGTDVHATPGSTTNVIFNETTGVANVNTVLGANTTINSLEFNSVASGAADVTIGSGTFGSANGTLTITASGTNFEGLTGVGLTVDSGAGTNVINAPITLGGNQTWVVNNSQSNPLTVNGAIGGAHALTLGGTGEIILAGTNTYSGSTIVSNGMFMVNGSLASNVSVSGSGASAVAVLGGTGTINGSVTIGGGSALGTNVITGGTPAANGTITLANGLTINSGGIVYFNNVAANTSANYINLTGGSLVANSGAFVYVPLALLTGTYDLIGGATGVTFSNFTVDYTNGSAAASNYALQLSSGTLQLVVSQAATAQPTLTLGNARVMMNQSGTLNGVLGNNAGGAVLNGTLSDNGGALAVSSFSPSNVIVVGTGTSAAYSAIVSNVGSSLGANSVNVIVTDGSNASPTTATASGTVSVVQNRTVSASTAAITVHVGSSGSATTNLTSPGADNANTRVTVADGGVDSGTNGTTVTGGNTATVFNGSTSDVRTVLGTFNTTGTVTGTVTLTTTGEGLTGESPNNVLVGYTAQVFSGQASWASTTSGSWGANGNWGDTNINDLNGAGAPGLAGSASTGDTAAFNNVAGQSGVITISLNGANPSLAGISFNSTNGYSIVAGSGGSITLQGAATPILVSTGTDTISVPLLGGGVSKTGTGTLVLGGADTYSGSTTIGNGVVQTTGVGVLPATTFLTMGDASGDSGQLVLGGNQTVTGMVSAVGSGSLNSIVGGTSTVSTLTISNSGTNTALVNTYVGNLGGSGANQNNLALTVTGTTVQVISGTITYTGATVITNGAVLQTSNLLPGTSSISLTPGGNTAANGGVWQPTLTGNTAYNFTIGTNSAGNVSTWTGGGFAAYGGTLTLTANGGALLTWGVGGAVNIGNVGGQSLTFGSQTSNNQVILTNNIYLDTTDTYSQNVTVNGTTAGSSLLLSGTISPGTGLSGLGKTGAGTLYLSGANTYTGFTQVANGYLVAQNNSFADGVTPGAFGIATSAISIGDAGGGNAQGAPTGANMGLMISGGNFTVARAISIGNTNNTVNSVTLGGLTNNFLTFSGAITTVKNFQFTQVATTGTNALNITAGVSAAANSDTVTFNNIGNVNVTGTIANGGGTISVTQAGSGTTTFSSGNTYTGTTGINRGVLNVTNTAGSATGTNNALSIAPNANASATLGGNGIITSAVTATNGGALSIAHIAPGVNTNGNFGGVGTLTLNGGLTINNGVNLDFDLGASSDLIAVGGQLTLGSGIVVNISQGAGFTSGTTYTLLTYTGALTGTTFAWSVAGGPPATTDTFTAGSGVVTLTIASTPAPGNAYWNGTYGSGGNGTWNTFANGGAYNTNWSTALSSGTDPLQVPSGTTNVYFIADTGSNTNTYLGQNFSINSLNFTGTDATVTTGSAVTISGSIAGSGTNNSLTINATSANGNTAGNGITTGSGAGADTINAPLVLGGNQTWTLNASPSSPLTVNGPISGAHALTVGGIGQLVLGGNNTFTNGLTINGSVNVVLNNTGALNSTSPDSVTFGPSSSGTINLNGNSLAFGSLSSNATPGAPVVQNNSATPATLTIDQTTSGTFAGVIQNGSSGALSLTMGGPAVLTLAGAETYTGATVVNGGYLRVNGSLASVASVTVNSSGTLGGSGTVHGAVTVASGGSIGAGTAAAPATITLTNGLVIQSGGIAEFNIISGGSNDLINITSGGLTLNSGAILQVTPYLTAGGTYALSTYTGADPSLSGIIEQTLGGGSLAANYSFVASGGTLELIVASSPVAVPILTVNTPVSGSRVISGISIAVSGSVMNGGTSNILTGTLSGTGGLLTVTGFSSGTVSVSPQSSVGYTASIANSGSNLGNNTFVVGVTDGNASPTSQTVTGTLDVVANRIVLSNTAPAYGVLHAGSVVSGTIVLSSTGADNQYTRVTVGDAGPDTNGISITGGNPSGTFNGSLTDSRTISGTFANAGNITGTLTLITTGEGLAGETPNNVIVNYTAQVFSGQATWSAIAGNGVWSTNGNWGDSDVNDLGGIGAPGLSGSLSIGDTALFGDYATETIGGTTTVSLNGVSPTVAGLTFNAINTTYIIATGTGSGALAMQSGASITVATGSDTIAANLTNAGALTFNGPGELIVNGTNDKLTGTMTVASGTLAFLTPSTIAPGAASTYNVLNGATLAFVQTGSFDWEVPSLLTVTGSGRVLFNSNGGDLQVHGNNLTLSGTGGVIEVASGTLESGGASGANSIIWTNNKDSLQLDAGSVFQMWNGNNVNIDALTGSGTVSRFGFGNGTNVVNLGDNNGSGTFAGTITNQFGTVNINKIGTGLQVFTGSSSFGGYVAIQGGTLRITNATGIGNFGISYITEQGQHTATASGSSTLDIYGGITVNEMLTLNNGSLVNSAVGTTSVFDSGIAGIDITNDTTSGTGGVGSPITVSINGGSGTGATAIAGILTPLNTNVGSSGTNLYTQMTAGGTGYQVSGTGAPTVSIIQSGTSVGGTATAVVSQLILSGDNNFIGGNGNLTINAQISGAGGFTTVGTGTLELANAETYTGPTVLGLGSTLELGTGYSSVGSITGAGSIVVAGTGTQTFAGLETYSGTTGINAGSTLQLGNGVSDGAIVSSTVSNNGSLVFATGGNQNLPAVISGTGTVTMNGLGNQELSGTNTYSGATFVNSGTLQIGNQAALSPNTNVTVSGSGSLNLSNGNTPQTVTFSGSQVLTLNNGASLDFGVTNTSNDLLAITGTATSAFSGVITINLSLISGTGQSTPFTIITDASDGLNNATFVLGNLPALSTGQIIAQTGSTLTVTFTGVTTAYWSGSNSGDWGDFTNFTSDITGTIPLTGTFGPTQDVVFSGSNAMNQSSSYLSGPISAHSLTIIDPAGVVIGSIGTNTLTLAGNTGNTGITVGSAAGSLQAEIDAGLDFTGTPNITVNNTGGLLITGIISGTSGIIVNGSGLLTLTGPGGPGFAAANSYSGGTELISGTLNVNADAAFGQSGSGNGVTFNPGAGNSVTLQSGTNGWTTAIDRTFTFQSGTSIIDPGSAGNSMTISGPVQGTGALQVIDTGTLILSGSVAFSGTANVAPGAALNLTFPGTIAQSGTIVFNTAPGSVLQLEDTAAQNISPAANGGVAFTGSGTLQATGPGSLQMHGSGNIYMDMSGGTIEVAGGLLVDGGVGSPVPVEGDPSNGVGSPTWTGTYNGTPFTNLSSLQIDATGTFDTWNGNNVMVDALNGSGVLTRLGYTPGAGSIVTIGDNNGSGAFSGTISNAFGSLSLIKTGSGTEIFSGTNSYSGSTWVNGGILRVTTSTGLGNGGPVFYTGAGAAVSIGGVTVTGSARLDLYGNIVTDKVITLNGGRLLNGDAGTTSVFDNGIAAVAIGGTQVGAYSSPVVSTTAAGGAPGNGTGATFTAGSGSAPGGVAVFAQVTAPGTGYTIAPTLVYADSTGTGSGVTATAVISSLSLQGNPALNFIGGNGNMTINAVISGTSGFSTTGTGTLTLTGSNTYAGATIVASGVMNNNGYITGVVNVNPGAGAATLGGTGTFGGLVSTAATSGSNIAHIAPGVNTGGNFGGIGTLALNNGLTIGNGTNLDFDLGTSSDLIAVTGALSLGSGVTLNISQAAGFAPGTYTLITYTGALTGNASSWGATGDPGENAVFASGGGVVTVTLTPGSNNSQLSITPATISLGSVLVGFTPSSTTGTLANTSGNGSSASYTTVATGSISASPANGTLGANGSTTLTVTGTAPVNLTSGNNQVIGTVSATNNSNASGSAAPVNVTANVFQQYSGTTPASTTGSGTAALTLTNLASTDGGQRAGVTISGFSTSNANFVATGTNGALVATANGSNVTATVGTVSVAPNRLNGAYSYSGSVTGTAGYTDPQLATQASVASQVWSNVTVSATVSGNASNARTNVFSAQIQSGSTYAGYSLSSSVLVSGTSQHPNTGSGGTTVATLLAGTASATTTVSMSFDSAPAPGNGPDDTGFRTSDILTLTGIHSTGSVTDGSLTVTLTDEYVLQLSYDISATALTELIGQNTGSIWVNAADLNSSDATEQLYANESYATYVAGTAGGDTPALGAYGYDAGVAWAVLDHTGIADPISEFAVIPEPGTYAMVFSGFGMLVGFRRLRRRAQRGKMPADAAAL